MSKQFRYALLLLCLSCMWFACSQKKKTDWHITFDKNSKEPYGCYIAFQCLSDFFPGTTIQTGRNLFTEINQSLDDKNANNTSQHFSIVVARDFEVDSLELDKLKRYTQKGNTVCILAENFSKNVFDDFHLQYNRVNPSVRNYYTGEEDTIANQHITIFLNHKEHTFNYNGLNIQHAFTTDSLFKGDYYYGGYAIHADTPSSMISYDSLGMFMICRHSITMTNDFLLHENNREYLQYFMSYFSAYPNSVTWYNMYHRQAKEESESNLSTLLKSPPLFYAFLVLLGLFLLFVLFESKRRQKQIPILLKNRNDSLEFTETVGMLYFNKKDHKNLAQKMILHYLENIRSKYNVKTNDLKEDFITQLSQKLNRSFIETKAFIAYLQYIRDGDEITEIDIKHLYQQIQKFT